MKISFTLLVILVISTIVVPFLIFILKGINSNAKKEIYQLINQNNFKYDVKAIWNNKFIGISEDKNTLTYIHIKEENKQFTNIKLSHFKTCDIVANYKIDKNKVNQLKQLDLKLTYNTPDKKDLIIRFFDANETFMENYEMRRIEYWKTLISNNLNHALINKKAA